MVKWTAGLLVFFFAVWLSGCAETKEGSGSISINPRSLSEEEQTLVSKTAVDGIEYYELDGTLGEGEDLEFSIEIYKDGKLVEDNVYTHGQPEKEYNQMLISYGYNKEEDTLAFINGIVNGLLETKYEIGEMNASSFTSLLPEKTFLKKDKPVYMAAWIGTNQNGMSTPSVNSDGRLSEGIDAEVAYVFKLVLSDRKRE